MPEDGRSVGPSAAVFVMWPCRMLRQFQEQTRDQALSRRQAPHRSVHRARRKLDVVLHRRVDVRRRLSHSPVGFFNGSGNSREAAMASRRIPATTNSEMSGGMWTHGSTIIFPPINESTNASPTVK